MRRETRERIRRESDVRGLQYEDPQSDPDGLFCNDMTDNARRAVKAARALTARYKRQYHAYMCQKDKHEKPLYPSYEARLNGTLDAYREQWLRERRAHLAATYGAE